MSNDLWNWVGKTVGQSQQALEDVRKEAERRAREAQEAAEWLAREAQAHLQGAGTVVQQEAERVTHEAQGQLNVAGKVVQGAAAQVTQGVAETVASVAGQDSPIAQAAAQVHQSVTGPSDTEPINLTALPEHQRVAFAGALFAMANADGAIDKDELQLIFELFDLDGLSSGGKHAVLGYIIAPPAFADTLAPFVLTPLSLRCALLLNLREVAYANDLIGADQEHLLIVARTTLAVDDAQYAALARFQTQMRQVRLRGLNDNVAAEAAKSAVAGLTAVGVPITAVYISGSVFGLSAAGITSGLAALGLGLGMVPGIGVAVLLGAGIFMGVRYLLDAGQEREKERLRAEAMRKAQLVIQNLQEAITMVIERLPQLQGAAADAETNREAIFQLHERLRALQQIIARRKDIAEALQ
ncbi:TerB family tellurite resistance protein [Oscillochloris sp. ZM17-4]|uniref:TerB family tellurite resistance protein n=1 Tax=Oscillochloris sp. ZM17-4 TaxID=2866714 RepID=UPI001C72B7AC|nr:TerB family tellurite resistance protein [Oscillochloris sp. ZM17-4]MBX0330816.1 TerB family tellurite resistance protein [Oscillochloris sp. ZM17-4]